MVCESDSGWQLEEDLEIIEAFFGSENILLFLIRYNSNFMIKLNENYLIILIAMKKTYEFFIYVSKWLIPMKKKYFIVCNIFKRSYVINYVKKILKCKILSIYIYLLLYVNLFQNLEDLPNNILYLKFLQCIFLFFLINLFQKRFYLFLSFSYQTFLLLS